MTERTYPISCYDSGIPWVFVYGLVVDGLLDGELAQKCFQTLITKKWRMVGARIRRDDEGNLIYAVPNDFADQPAFTSEIKHHPTPLSSHLTLPTPTPTPSIQPCPSLEIFRPPTHQRQASIDGYISSSQPIFHLQICHFSDGKSSIGLAAPHCFADASGMKAVFEALGRLMNGVGVEEIGEALEDTMVMEKIKGDRGEGREAEGLWVHDLSKPGVMPAGKAEVEMREVCIPQVFLDGLLRECRGKLEGTFVSEGDVMTAWWIKTCLSSAPPERLSEKLAITLPIDIRRLPAFSSGVYLHNALASGTTTFPSISHLLSLPIHTIASELRKSIARATPENVANNIEYTVEMYHSTPDHHLRAVHFPADYTRVGFSNWLKLSWGGGWFVPRLEGGGEGRVVWFGGGPFQKDMREPARPLGGCAAWRTGGEVWLRYALEREWWGRGELERMEVGGAGVVG